jgi:hypothetical protein
MGRVLPDEEPDVVEADAEPLGDLAGRKFLA